MTAIRTSKPCSWILARPKRLAEREPHLIGPRPRSIFSPDSKACKRILAGGLNPANVAEAITVLRPSGVDAVSGLESEARAQRPVQGARIYRPRPRGGAGTAADD